MKKAVKIFAIYLLFLLVCSVILGKFNFSSDSLNTKNTLFGVQVIMIPTIIGGIIALKLLVPPKPLKIFLLVYLCLWIFRIGIIYLANKIGEIHLGERIFRIDLILTNYYKTASRLETPLPFVIFWFVYHFYTKIQKNKEQTELPE